MKKLDYIDALRGYAVLGVLMVHTGLYSTNLPGVLQHIIMQGARGVQLFYIASAFTLFLSFSYRSGQERFPIKNFFIRRFFRIAPMYYTGIIYYLIQEGMGPRYWLGDAPGITVPNVVSNFFFLHGFSPYWMNSLVPGGWSVAVEMVFYVILPFLFLRIKNKNDALLFFILSIIFKTLLHLLFSKFSFISDNRLWQEYLFMYFPSQLPVFALGILLYFCAIDNRKETVKFSGNLLFFLGSLLCLQLATGVEYIFPEYIVWAGVFFIITISLSRYSPIVLINPVINYIGKISFSMYLVHFAVLHWLQYFNFTAYFGNGTVDYITRFYIVIMFSMLLAALTYNYIELPFQNIGKILINRTEKMNNSNKK